MNRYINEKDVQTIIDDLLKSIQTSIDSCTSEETISKQDSFESQKSLIHKLVADINAKTEHKYDDELFKNMIVNKKEKVIEIQMIDIT